MRRLVTGTLAAANDTVVLPLGDAISFVGIKGTYTVASVVFEGTADGTKWNPVAVYTADTSLAQYDTITLTDSTTYGWNIPNVGLQKLRIKLVGITTGSITVSMVNSPGKLPPTDQGKISNYNMGVGLKVANVAAGVGTADVAVVAGKGIIHRINFTALASAALSLYDHATSSSGLSPLYTSAATAAQGLLTELNLPFSNGIVAGQLSGSGSCVIIYSLN